MADESFLSVIGIGDAIRQSGIPTYRDSARSRHRLVMSLFPDGLGSSPRSSAGVLFRLEAVRSGQRVTQRLLIRSAIRPLEVEGMRTVCEDLSLLPEPGSPVSFRVTASPISRKGSAEFHLRGHEEQESWLRSRLSGGLEEIEILDLGLESPRRNPGKEPTPSVPLVQFDGVGAAGDTGALRDLLLHGVGRNKNYGAGLLTVRAIG